jgi:hypothetical protein
MAPLFGSDAVTSRADFRRDALCHQILRLRRADYRDCGYDSDDDATHASHLKSANGVAPNFVHAVDACHLLMVARAVSFRFLIFSDK